MTCVTPRGGSDLTAKRASRDVRRRRHASRKVPGRRARRHPPACAPDHTGVAWVASFLLYFSRLFSLALSVSVTSRHISPKAASLTTSVDRRPAQTRSPSPQRRPCQQVPADSVLAAALCRPFPPLQHGAESAAQLHRPRVSVGARTLHRPMSAGMYSLTVTWRLCCSGPRARNSRTELVRAAGRCQVRRIARGSLRRCNAFRRH